MTASDDTIICRIDNARVHSVQLHIKKNHPDWSVERYQREFPGEPLLSKLAEDRIRAKKATDKAKLEEEAIAGPSQRKPMHEIFGLPAGKTMNARGKAIMVRVFDQSQLTEDDLLHIPAVDPNYVFNIELTKNALIALEINKAGLFWGYHGTGKTTQWEQVCARTGRPFVRIQHTINTEEAHVLGQYVVRDGATVFQPGMLPLAMKHGWVFCADEYDIALPAVTALYQPVLEGKALLIKDAPPEWRITKPHPNFRFVATGNTNGCGDETGLYQGTQMQNAANYSRFGLTEEVGYMEPKVEAAVIAGQSGCRMDDANKIVRFAAEVRKNFTGGQLSSTVSPRELINAAVLAIVRGNDWVGGLKLAFANRLSRADKEVCLQFAQRIWGE